MIMTITWWLFSHVHMIGRKNKKTEFTNNNFNFQNYLQPKYYRVVILRTYPKSSEMLKYFFYSLPSETFTSDGSLLKSIGLRRLTPYFLHPVPSSILPSPPKCAWMNYLKWATFYEIVEQNLSFRPQLDERFPLT